MRVLASLLLIITVFALPASAQQGQFPTLTAENLNKQPVTLPRDFRAQQSILLLAFQQRQQADVDTWFPALKVVEQARPGVRYYELPVLASSYGLVRGFIDGGMRSGIPDPAQRARTITLYTNVDAFLRRLGLPTNKSTIYAVRIDASGRVLGAVSGRYTREKAERLLQGL